MPVYEYECHDCGERFEHFVRAVGKVEALACPECGSEDVEKVVSLFGGVGGSSAQSRSRAASCNTGST